MKKFLTIAAVAATLTAGSATIASAQAAGASRLDVLLQQCAANPASCTSPAVMRQLVAAARAQGGGAAAIEASIARVVSTVSAANAAVVRSTCESNPGGCAAATRNALQNVRTAAQTAGVSTSVVNNAVGAVIATVVSVGNSGTKSQAVMQQIAAAVQLAADPTVGFLPSSNAAEQATINARVTQALNVQQSFNNGSKVSQQVLAQLGSGN